MSDGWEKVRLGDILVILTDYHANGAYEKLKAKVELLDKENYALMIRTTNFEQNDFLKNNKYITKDAYDFLNKSKVYDGDLIMNKIANAGSIYLMPKLNRPVSLAMNLFLIRLNNKRSVPRYIYYNLKANERYVKSFAQGSVTKTITKDAVRNLEIILPPLSEQKAIAHILGTLDDKIELNRQMNQTIEAMAQALFKSWFVDFDPVIDNAIQAGIEIPEELQARAEKRKGLSDSKKLLSTNPTLAAHFPDSFVFNETLGKWIPEGWEVKSLGELATVVGGGTPSTKIEDYFTDNGISWLSPKDLSGYTWKYIGKGATDITELGLKNSGAKLMPPGTVLFSSRAPIGYISIAENEICTNQGFKSLVPDKGVPTEYLYQLLKSNADKIEAVATGSTFKEVSGSALKGIEVLVPSSELLFEYSKKLKPSSERQLTIQKETETLTQLRDRLLPELISGRVRVK